MTLNMLRSSRIHPHLSAYAHMFGEFDFNKTPLAPPGTKALVHEKPAQRTSWGYNGVEDWYVGPALEHYRCVTCYIPETKRERIADTVKLFPHNI